MFKAIVELLFKQILTIFGRNHQPATHTYTFCLFNIAMEKSSFLSSVNPVVHHLFLWAIYTYGYVSHKQMVYPIKIPLNHYKIPLNPYKILYIYTHTHIYNIYIAGFHVFPCPVSMSHPHQPHLRSEGLLSEDHGRGPGG